MEDNRFNHSSETHCLIFDPIPFFGGSKSATQEALMQCNNSKVSFTLLTASPECWQNQTLLNRHNIQVFRLWLPHFLLSATQGLAYWIKQCFFFLMIVMTLLRVKPIDKAVGMSGPGVDMSLYIAKLFYRFNLIQLIHGPVAQSGSIGYCLSRANRIFALDSCHNSVQQALSAFINRTVSSASGSALASFALTTPRYQYFQNGISEHHWPTPCYYGEPRLFWAASLLKWKGLDTLIEAAKLLSEQTPLAADICFIRPQNTSLPVSKAPVPVTQFNWHENPANLDQIRARNNIFISTSHNEPFGLSILEAMAAGMCVIIPADNAYWDRHLSDGVNCLKYQPDNAVDLYRAICRLVYSPDLIQTLGQKAGQIAESYRAEQCYREMAVSIAAK